MSSSSALPSSRLGALMQLIARGDRTLRNTHALINELRRFSDSMHLRALDADGTKRRWLW